VKDDSDQLSYAVALCTSWAFALSYFLGIVISECFIIANNGQYDLIERLSKIFIPLFGYCTVLGIKLARFMVLRGYSYKLYELGSCCKVANMTNFG
jgi:hypothetical protein